VRLDPRKDSEDVEVLSKEAFAAMTRLTLLHSLDSKLEDRIRMITFNKYRCWYIRQ
jgi:hypothetical protein